jgi:S1-C subfamily serine protease
MTALRVLASASLGFAMIVGCGGETPAPTSAPVREAPPPPTASAAPASSGAPAARGIKRSDIEGVVAQGLGSFLQKVEFEAQPARATNGAFHGFRIAALHDEAFWRGVDLKPGDVITSVNGFSIEHPNDARMAFESLQVSSELRVAYERDGAPRELVYPIVADR